MSISTSYGKILHYSKSEQINHSEHLNINGIDRKMDRVIFLEMGSVTLTAIKLESNITENAHSLTLFFKSYSHEERFLVADVEKASLVIPI